jgi:nicotinate phosphoribosyltransferase
MAQSYVELGLTAPATFALTVRQLPPDWGFLVAAGIPRARAQIARLGFDAGAVRSLGATRQFSTEFLTWLGRVRFAGSVRALPEGCPFFAEEPVLEVTAPLPVAQLLETLLLNSLQLPILAATKAARCVHAAAGRVVVDFGMRRAHGADAAHELARSAYLAGVHATSNVEAGLACGIPLVGTMAHSYVLAFASEIEAFRAYAFAEPERCVLLVDTYDALEGVRRAAQVGGEMARRGETLAGVRLDSGDLDALARRSRQLLDAAGLQSTRIIASGGLDEYRIEALLASGAPIDSFGVGTALGVPPDAPTLDIVYKLVEYAGRPVGKQSPGKITPPGSKQVWRELRNGRAVRDRLGLAGENRRGMALLADRDAVPPSPPAALTAARERCAAWLAQLPAATRRLRAPAPYPVEDTPALANLRRRAWKQKGG